MSLVPSSILFRLMLHVAIAGALSLGVASASHAQEATCDDPARTLLGTGGCNEPGPGCEGCRDFDGDPTSCEIAWTVGGGGTVSCFVLDGDCEGCGPNNEGDGLCTNTCVSPAGGTPVACTIGFWNNRADTPLGQSHHFPDPQFGQVVAAAADLTSVFDGSELVTALVRTGKRTQEQKAEQQLAALLLNLAAGDLFPDNQKCELFETNEIADNACVVGATVGEALAGILADLEAAAFEQAKDCADDINNGIGVQQEVETDQ